MEEAVLTAKKQPVQTERSVSITYEVIGGEFTGIGSQIRLSAVLSGFDEVEPTYQWQYSNGGEWVDIGGATSSDYTLTVTEDNCTYSWRVSVTG